MKKIAVHMIAGTFALCSLATSAAMAADDFATVDADGNGQVTMEEAQAAMPDLSDEKFKAADANADGTLSAEEFATVAAE